MRKILLVLGLLMVALGYAQPLQPKGIIVNPTPPQDLQLRVWVDKDPNKVGNPVYQFGENIQISVQVSQTAYVYLFSVRATGEISGILPNAYEQNNLLEAGEVRTFPDPYANYTFKISPPAGQDRVLAVASRNPLDVSQIINIQTGEALISGTDNLARSLSIVVTPVPRQDWVSNEAFYFAGQITTGTLVVNSQPAGAEVLINGQSIGTTPLSINLNAGNYSVELRRPGYNNLRTTASIQAGRTVTLSPTMVLTPPPQGTLRVNSNPSGSQVLINGRVVGNTPLTIKLNSGSYAVEIRRSGFTTYKSTIVVSTGASVRLDATLTPENPVIVPNPGPKPPTGQLVYVCRGGRLVVNYSGNQVSIFYDGANRVLNLVRTNPNLVYENAPYTWEISGRSGRISVNGQLADTCQY